MRRASCIAASLCLAATGLAAQADTVPDELRNRFAVEYGYTAFQDDATDPWHQATAELAVRTRGGTWVGRTSWADRFGETGVQLEADAYPRLSPRTYLYLNAGWSDAVIFPRWRAGAELYGSMRGGWELSGGARRLWFSDTGVTLLTGSVGRYAGSYYLSARPYVTPRDGDTGVSGSLLVRRYFGAPDSHATLVVGAGSTPSEAPLEFEVERLTSQRVTLYGRHPLARRLGVRWSAGWEREEIVEGADRTRLSAGAGLEARF